MKLYIPHILAILCETVLKREYYFELKSQITYGILMIARVTKPGAAVFLSVGLIAVLASCASDPRRGLVPTKRTMLVTAYCPCKQCCSWKRNWYGMPVNSAGAHQGERKKIGQTASGAKVRRGTIAADSRYDFGILMDVPGYGTGVVKDRGGAIKGNHIDVFFKRHSEALRWGRKNLTVTVWLPRGHRLLTQ
jgi:3D (Asp-Asp-Asp) domain-containing protein